MFDSCCSCTPSAHMVIFLSISYTYVAWNFTRIKTFVLNVLIKYIYKYVTSCKIYWRRISYYRTSWSWSWNRISFLRINHRYITKPSITTLFIFWGLNYYKIAGTLFSLIRPTSRKERPDSRWKQSAGIYVLLKFLND